MKHSPQSRKGPGPHAMFATDLLAHLSSEQQRLVNVLRDVAALGQQGCFTSANKRFAELRAVLEPHIDAEEQILLPRLERSFPEGATALRKIRLEHGHLRSQLNGLAAALSEWNLTRVEILLPRLEHRLSMHYRHEAEVIDPKIARAIGSLAELRELLREQHLHW